MIVLVRFEIGDEARRALRARLGKPGLATRKEVQLLADTILACDVADACADLRAARDRRAAGKDAPAYGFRRASKEEVAAKIASGEWPAAMVPVKKKKPR